MDNNQEQWAKANEQELWDQEQREYNQSKDVTVKIEWRKILKQAQKEATN